MYKILSIIIPTYNMEKYLDKCLTSLIIDDKELMKQLEVLVVNDGSKDSSSGIGHKYESLYPDTFRVIDKENGNYGSCVNRGLKEAKGKYIKVLDADDSFKTANFTRFINLLLKCDADLVLTNYTLINEKGVEYELKERQLPKNQLLELPEYLVNISGNKNKEVQMHAVTFKKTILEEMGYVQQEGISYTDQEWVLYPIASCNTAIYFDLELYVYLVGREGQTIQTSEAVKNAYHHIIRTKKNILELKKYTFNDVRKRNYVYARLLSHCYTIYHAYIILNRGTLNISNLREFDMFVQKHVPELHHAILKLPLCKELSIPYIKIWLYKGTIMNAFVKKSYFALEGIKTVVRFFR